jgi:hypothetical protein
MKFSIFFSFFFVIFLTLDLVGIVESLGCSKSRRTHVTNIWSKRIDKFNILTNLSQFGSL